MKQILLIGLISIFAAAGWAQQAGSITPSEAAKKITWYGQNSLRIELEGKIIWIDPVGISVDEKADVILITHGHGDHYAPSLIKRLTGPSTVVLMGFDAPESFTYQRVKPGDVRTFSALTVEAVPMYNIKKSAHPKDLLLCGFIISGQGVRIYDTGDTERIPEMASMRADIILLPLGQTYTMNSVADAEQAALDVKAVIAIPVHYGMYEGTEADADKFVADMTAKGVTSFRLKRM
jgi:L-ascorbate metabolism protein UlaG (beta-lactamase superfamily)